MIYKFLYLLFFLFFISCVSHKHKVEYLEYYYKGSPISRKDDKIFIKYIPNKKDVKVELVYHGKIFSRKPINKKEYQEILAMFFQIKNDDEALIDDILIKKEIKIAYMDAGATKIIYFKDNIIKEHLVLGNTKEGDENFYDTTILIYKYAGLDPKYIR